MQLSEAEIGLALSADIQWIGELLARAFYDDPMTCYLLPAPGVRSRRAPSLFGMTTKVVLDKGEVWADRDRRTVALWAAPGRWKDTPRDLLHQLPSLPAFGIRLPRALRVLRILDESHSVTPHWYLEAIGTDPGQQGKGLGSAVIRPVLERCDRDGVAAYLVSSNPLNLPFYQRHGFRLDGELSVPGGPTLYPMWRDPISEQPR
jgi:GNAT superfamily N-acetyltransferase